MPITFPTNTRETINSIRGVIGREVTFQLKNEVVCSSCSIDPVTDTSTDPFCITCSGVGYIITYSGVAISAHITHDPTSTHWTPGGTIPDGDCRIQVEYTDSNITVVEEADHVIVDSLKYDIKKVTRRGVPQINRVLLDLIERIN